MRANCVGGMPGWPQLEHFRVLRLRCIREKTSTCKDSPQPLQSKTPDLDGRLCARQEIQVWLLCRRCATEKALTGKDSPQAVQTKTSDRDVHLLAAQEMQVGLLRRRCSKEKASACKDSRQVPHVIHCFLGAQETGAREKCTGDSQEPVRQLESPAAE